MKHNVINSSFHLVDNVEPIANTTFTRLKMRLLQVMLRRYLTDGSDIRVFIPLVSVMESTERTKKRARGSRSKELKNSLKIQPFERHFQEELMEKRTE